MHKCDIDSIQFSKKEVNLFNFKQDCLFVLSFAKEINVHKTITEVFLDQHATVYFNFFFSICLKHLDE